MKRYDSVRTLSGQEIYVPSGYDGYGETIEKVRSIALETNRKCSEFLGEIPDVEDYRKYLNILSNRRLIGVIFRCLKFRYLLDLFVFDQNKKFIVLRDIFHFIEYISFGTREFQTSRVSNILKSRIANELNELSILKLSSHFDLVSHRLEDLHLNGITRVILKTFQKNGVGYVLGRVISDDGITVLREGVSESVSCEHAELMALHQIMRTAVGKEKPIEIISSQANIVNWIEQTSNPRKYLDLRSELGDWFDRVGATAKQMSALQNAIYRKEKRSGFFI